MYYNFYIVNLVFVLPELNCKTKKFKVESHFVKRKHYEGTFEGMRTPLCVAKRDSFVKCKRMTKVHGVDS